MGGLGLTDLHTIRHTAFYASNAHALHTWSRHLGSASPIITKWVDGSTRTSNQLKKALDEQVELIKLLNTTKIKPADKQASAHLDKGNPEAQISVPLPPTLPQSLSLILKLKHAEINKVQHILTKIHSVLQFRSNWKAINKDDVAKRTQYLANSVATSNIWLRSLPNNRKFRLSRFEYRFNLLQHFALDNDIDALLDLPPLHPLACACNKTAFRPPDTTEDGGGDTPRATYQHLLNCTNESAFTTRHNQIVNDCAEAVRSVGLNPVLEAGVSKTPTATANQHQKKQKLRFDITVAGISNTNTLQCDVSVTSHRQREKSFKDGCSNVSLYAADSASKAKVNKFINHIYPDSESIVPLIAETSGAIHSGFTKFFEALGTRVDGKAPLEATWTTPTFSSYWMAVISTTLRRESAQSLRRLARKALALSGQPGPVPLGLQPGGLDLQ
jgi:hypothetical protein